MFNKVIKIGYNCSILFLLTFTNVLILSSFLFLFKVSISVFHLPLSFIIATVELYFLRKRDLKETLISLGTFIIAFLITIAISGNIYDTSYDGNSYHKQAIGFLKNGWNPIYETSENFSKELNIKSAHDLWLDNYPKATWIYGASVYKITNNIETAKSFNILILIASFLCIIYVINKIYQRKLLAFIMALAVCLFPIIWQQVFSLYLDGFLGLTLFLLIVYMSLFFMYKEEKEFLFIAGSLLIIITNIKFTGLFYAMAFCTSYYIYYLINNIKNTKTIIKTTGILAFIMFISIILVGSNSYVKNTIDHKNPLYPLIGKDKVDIMTYLQPVSFKNMSPIEKNFYSLFSYTANIGEFNNGEPVLKKPFTKNENEIYQFSEDTRIGGFGVYFSGIFIISLLVIFPYFINLIRKKDIKDFILLGLPVCITITIMFLLGESWWARYAPQIYLIPLIATYILLKEEKPIMKFFGIILVVMCFVNTAFFAPHLFKTKIQTSGEIKNNLESNNGKNLEVKLVTNHFTGTLFNLQDYNIDYKIVSKLDKGKQLYTDKIIYKEK